MLTVGVGDDGAILFGQFVQDIRKCSFERAALAAVHIVLKHRNGFRYTLEYRVKRLAAAVVDDDKRVRRFR
ncbi:hypothetical protein SDC9_127073 [bioreactor metagenome]|uniref:Uncharacterized protein n=1 Tax=bioreactor metagenome TaxID=1076179 RepID=A0A645CT17_9ZZZZ